MTDHTEARVDARSTECPCCGDRIEGTLAGSRLCSDCVARGCDPGTDLCLGDL